MSIEDWFQYCPHSRILWRSHSQAACNSCWPWYPPEGSGRPPRGQRWSLSQGWGRVAAEGTTNIHSTIWSGAIHFSFRIHCIPNICIQVVVSMVKPIVIAPDNALCLKARRDLVDSNGVWAVCVCVRSVDVLSPYQCSARCTGELWLVRDIGAYLSGVYEEVCFLSAIYSTFHKSFS